MDSGIVINETHIAVLCETTYNNNLQAQYIPLLLPYQDSMNALRILCENENRDALEVERYIDRSDLADLKRSFNYCRYLDRPYQNLLKYAPINEAEYFGKKEKFQADIVDPTLKGIKFINELRLRDIDRDLKCDIYQEFKERQLAYALDAQYKALVIDDLVFAHSHRKVGFSYPEFQLGEDFKVGFYTNFGYGNSSFFYTNISYKGIDIRPYSDWILYRYAQKHDIIRYTRTFYLENKHWKYAMNFAAETFNQSINSPQTFIEGWIIRECKEMVEGLEELLASKKQFIVKESYFNTKVSITLTDLDLILFKGERTSGALSFLEKISELSPISPQIEGYINRIMECNFRVLQQMGQSIVEINERLSSQNSDLVSVKVAKVGIEEKLEALLAEKARIIADLKVQNDGEEPNQNMLEEIFTHLNPIETAYRNDLFKLTKNISEINVMIGIFDRTIDKLKEYITVIEKHLSV
jgi:hypothetical protein